MRPEPRAGRTGHWRVALREFGVIVAGVLAALGAQAWWESSQEREREREYLRQLLSDTRENERRLDDAIALDSTTDWAVRRLAGGLYGPGPLPPPDTLLAWFGDRTFSSSGFQPLSGTYGALLAAGDLRLIRTDSLRARLVAYAARLEHEQAMLRFFLEQAFDEPAAVARPMPFLRRLVFGPRVPGLAASIDFERMRRDPEVEALLFAVQIANLNRISHLRDLREETRRLRRALEAEPSLRRERARR
ncbi:MAG TPA: hypothetical protein VFX98_00640 [Longimicrobiaceae bacterium]|nr:hypothetical protein [Longimicrobiaceae bacterium]